VPEKKSFPEILNGIAARFVYPDAIGIVFFRRSPYDDYRYEQGNRLPNNMDF